METLRAILVVKGHSREAAQMMSRALRESSLHVYESHWARFVSLCRSKKMACVQSQKPSFQYLHDAPVQRPITPIDYHFTSQVCGFCVTSFGLRSDSRPTHSSYSSELFGWNVRCNAESCPSGTLIWCLWH